MRCECVVECCPCGLQCSNRQLQEGSTLSLAVIDCGRKGVGVVALEDISVGCFIGEYVGEVLTNKEAKLRSEVQSWCYMLQLSRNRVIDATFVGGRMRFVNHSCEPNCAFEKWNVRGGAGALRSVLYFGCSSW
ncbi:Histone-lysine N-methyltransferase [Phytophthora megakarya]|uniref:Histone-lysine N-methyltransferase n=1 Tax=Phytophthora megakarya TaxID=4795 RepID=A0A225UWN6_9STRA|nr:Histone-lysine N-methyltransferase [Phytophthora megakarya]